MDEEGRGGFGRWGGKRRGGGREEERQGERRKGGIDRTYGFGHYENGELRKEKRYVWMNGWMDGWITAEGDIVI